MELADGNKQISNVPAESKAAGFGSKPRIIDSNAPFVPILAGLLVICWGVFLMLGIPHNFLVPYAIAFSLLNVLMAHLLVSIRAIMVKAGPDSLVFTRLGFIRLKYTIDRSDILEISAHRQFIQDYVLQQTLEKTFDPSKKKKIMETKGLLPLWMLLFRPGVLVIKTTHDIYLISARKPELEAKRLGEELGVKLVTDQPFK